MVESFKTVDSTVPLKLHNLQAVLNVPFLSLFLLLTHLISLMSNGTWIRTKSLLNAFWEQIVEK